MLNRFPMFACSAALFGSLVFLSANVAMAGEIGAPARPSATMNEAATAQPVGGAASKETTLEPGTFLANGSPVRLESLGMTITPPEGWDVSTFSGSLSLVMREPKVETPSFDKPKYQRNITVAAIHKAAPIDEKRATELADELTKQFTADQTVQNFNVLEHKFFNYRGAGDGLLVYSSMTLGEYPMMQMHILVSGQDKQFLLTYTDLAERFSDTKDHGFEKAWSAMISTEVTGTAPSRISEYYRYGAVGGALAFIALGAFLFRRRADHTDYQSEADSMIEEGDIASPSMIATFAGRWKLTDDTGERDVSGIEFSSHAFSVARGRDFVSNY